MASWEEDASVTSIHLRAGSYVRNTGACVRTCLMHVNASFRDGVHSTQSEAEAESCTLEA